MELISPLLQYAGELEYLEELLFELELQAFEREIDELTRGEREENTPVWGASPGSLIVESKRRHRTRVKARLKTAKRRGIQKSPKKKVAIKRGRRGRGQQGRRARSPHQSVLSHSG
jgi:hypothetical protein